MRAPLLTLLGMLLLASGSTVTAETSPSAVVPMTRQLDFESEVNGRSYRIQVAVPFAPAPEKGYAVLYVLDGDGYFGTCSFAARMRGMYGELDRRQYDFTATLAMTREQVKATVTDAAMVRNAKDPGDRPRTLPGTAGYAAESRVFEGETHVSVARASVGPFLSFALKP